MAQDPINRRRGLVAGELPRRYLRRNERADPDDLDPLDTYDPGDDVDYYVYDNYWQAGASASAADFLLHRLSTEVQWSLELRPHAGREGDG